MIPTSDQPKGMGGWLLFFTITLTLRFCLGLVVALGAFALMDLKPGTGPALTLFAVAAVGMAAYTGWMAYVFWRLKPNAVRLLSGYFGALLAYSLVLVLIRFVPHEASPETAELFAGGAKTAFGSVVYIAIWTTYFRKSQRVANTFGQPVAAA